MRGRRERRRSSIPTIFEEGLEEHNEETGESRTVSSPFGVGELFEQVESFVALQLCIPDVLFPGYTIVNCDPQELNTGDAAYGGSIQS